jgi:hypothetical protein
MVKGTKELNVLYFTGRIIWTLNMDLLLAVMLIIPIIPSLLILSYVTYLLTELSPS